MVKSWSSDKIHSFASIKQIYKSMRTQYPSNEELEQYWFQYKTEGEIHSTALEKFCRDQHISYEALDNWRRHTKNKIYEVEIVDDDHTASETALPSEEKPADSDSSRFRRAISCKHRIAPSCNLPQNDTEVADMDVMAGPKEKVRIMVTIKATNGLYISQRNLDYDGVRRLFLPLPI